jgi:tetratricopeptide (TPR) repeat protein
METEDWLDVEAFERRIKSQMTNDVNRESHSGLRLCTLTALTEAVELYRADFLEAVYDDWALLERERLRELYLLALERLIMLHKQRNDYRRALTYAQRLVVADPLREGGHRELMRLYHVLGRSRTALNQFLALRNLLAEELDSEPSPSTVSLFHEITATLKEARVPHLPPPASAPPLLCDPARVPFVGRTSERTALIGGLQTTLRDHGTVAVIEGDAGVGKSRLVEELIAGARWRGFQVGLAKTAGLAAPGPYQLLCDSILPMLTPLHVTQLAQLLDPIWLSVISPLLPPITEQLHDLPPLPSLDPRKEQQRLWEGLSRCLRALASVAPLLWVLEDIHWADEATLRGIPRLAQSLRSSRVFIVLTYRPAEALQRTLAWETLDTLDRTVPLLHISLSSFQRLEAISLVQRALGVGATDARATAFAQRLQDEVGSNALLLVETLRSLVEREGLTPVRSLSSVEWVFPADGLPLPTPSSVQELINGRVTRLASELRRVLELVAVLGEDADATVLTGASDLEPARLLATADELRRRGFLVETERRYLVEHDRIREIIYETVPSERRQLLHRRAGTALETFRPERVEALAHHFHSAHAWDKAADYSKRAGDRATLAYAHSDAAAHYTRALEALGRQPEPASPLDRFELLLAREGANGLLGRREDQARDLHELATVLQELGDDRQRAIVALRQASYHDVTSDYPAVIEVARLAVKWATQGEDPVLEAKGHVTWGRALWFQGDHASAQRSYERALELAQTAADRRTEADCLQSLGTVHYDLNQHARARDCLEQALAIRRSLGDRYGEAESLNSLGNVCSDVGEPLAARDYYEQSLAVKQALGDRRGVSLALYNLSVLHRDRGDGSAARRCCEEALAIAQEIGDRRVEAYVLTYLGLILERLHAPECPSAADLAVAEEHYARALAIRRQIGQPTLAIDSLAGLARVALAQGRSDAALHRADEALEWIAEHGPAGIGDVELVYQSAYTVLKAVGQQERANAVLSAAYELLLEWAAGLPDKTARHSLLEEVWPNREIVAAYRALAGETCVRKIQVRLPATNAPTGRPLRDDEYRDVVWTIETADDDEISKKVARRRHRILRLLREAAEQSTAPTLDDLAEALDVSVRTIRRDLAAMRTRGHEVQTRGSRARRS